MIGIYDHNTVSFVLVSEVNKRLDLTEGGKEGKAANEMERREGSQKPHKEKGLVRIFILFFKVLS